MSSSHEMFFVLSVVGQYNTLGGEHWLPILRNGIFSIRHLVNCLQAKRFKVKKHTFNLLQFNLLIL